MLSASALLSHSAFTAASAAVAVGFRAAQYRMLQLTRGVTSSGSGSGGISSTQQQQTGKSVGASDELLAKLKDKELLRTCGLIGGKWSEASNGATYDVSTHAHLCLPGLGG